MLPSPNLDDRRFQDLVDDAKRMVAHYCPEWTDHNVSDPGVTLIESFAFMVDQLFYRLNRVPDRLYVAFLELLGVTLHPPTAASVDLLMWLSAPQPDTVVIPKGTEVSTRRTEDDEAVVFATTRELTVPPRRLDYVMTQGRGGVPVPHSEALQGDGDFACFGTPPLPGEVLLLGLNDQAPSCAVALRFECEVRGVGVNPRNPPLVWEAWDGAGWAACELDSDGTGGLNRPGDVVIHVPHTHAASLLGGVRAGWLRCRVVDPTDGYPPYSASPTVRSAQGFTIGGSVPAVHAETITDEVIGMSEGVPGQSFELGRHPVVPGGEPFVVEIASGSGWDAWTEVDSFAGCGAKDRVIAIDRTAGIVHFPPAVREPDGSLRHYGAVPPVGSPVRIPQYRTGGGPTGNVAARALSVLRSSIPFVNSVENRRAAQGGVAPETIEQAKLRGPLALRTRDRAITAEDYEQLAKRAAPDIARVRCIPAGGPDEAGGVRVLVVPAAVPNRDRRLTFEDLVPDEETLSEVASYLDARRPVGTRVVVEPPYYRGVTVVAQLTARPRMSRETLKRDALRALYEYFDPISGGPDGGGWPFGRPVQAGEVHAVLQQLAGTEIVDEVLVFAADPVTGRRGEPLQRVELERNALVFSFDHRVRVSEGA
ncbi:putative phage baseplate assembly protein [Arthrobacter sp. V4I6]|uniref:putative baseplate assembly protein n=1 Tax=unclassified Arthrobacter TaxID=235627 RepID=UPI00278871C0|nr:MULTISPECIES: putative baseplate assembly protein [unclassified Arthrobacter]MDQ0821173.1 putative phage baseplate assembly protein [Arthrobacter sp. V1I7]MDQ0855436.1 putative phage baseplate assembly protein [Arthrobacter sp. V4I6]